MKNEENDKKEGQLSLSVPALEASKVLSTLPTKEEVMNNDILIKGFAEDTDTFDMLDLILAEMAQEGASLKYERLKKDAEGKDTDRVSLRRANILKMILDSIIEKRNLALNDIVNLKSPQWRLVFDHLLSKMKKTFVDLEYSSEQIELFFQKLEDNLEGFEEETEVKLKNSFTSKE